MYVLDTHSFGSTKKQKTSYDKIADKQRNNNLYVAHK